MTQLDFLDEVRKSYLQARQIIYQPAKNLGLLSRGTSHSISSKVEDLFGCYCANKVNKPSNLKILIDPPLSFQGNFLRSKSGKKSLLIRPDIAFCKENIITCLFDIKTDIGFNRNVFFDLARERNAQIESIKNHSLRVKDGNSKEQVFLTIAENVKFVYVILSSSNGLEETLNKIRNLENMEAFLLFNGEHLNSYMEFPVLKVNDLDFNKLDLLIEGYLN